MGNNESNGKSAGRGTWGSNFGFIMAAVGSAVGLGNLWGFPYKLGKSGGFAFLLVYLIFVVTVGVVVILGELAIGRKTKLSPVGAYRAMDKRFTFNGWFGILAAFVILSFYSVLGSWSLKYFITYVLEIFGAGFNGMSGGDFFGAFVSDPVQSIIYHTVFMALTGVIVLGGVQAGIEKYSKVMMPALFVLLVVIIIRSVTLPGAMAGVEFMFKPDFSFLSNASSFFSVVSTALAQMFFSLSLGMGAMVAYGSYLGKDSNLVKNSMIIPALDTLVALMAGLAIMPAVFATGIDPASGPSLLYITLREVFSHMAGGAIFGAIFYLLIVFAALTSAISLLEVSTSYFVDEQKWTRKKATLVAGAATFVVGIPTALSFGVLSKVRLPALNGQMMEILDWMDYLGEYVLMTLGAFVMCILIGWVVKPEKCIDEIEANGVKFPLKHVWSFMIKYVTPVFVLMTFLTSAGFVDLIINALSGK